MAQRPIWRGHLRLALVSCPVALYNAHHDRATLHFNLINPQTGNRIRMLSVDAETGDEVKRGATVKGYEFKKDHYLILEEADFEAARVPSSTTMAVEKFIPKESLDPIYYDSSYYVGPDGDAGADVFAVLRDAIVASGMAALSHVVMARRERVVAIVPMGRGLVAHTLHEERDLNNAGDVFDRIPNAETDPEMVKLATQLIDRQVGAYDPADVEDRYETRLREVIEAKLKGEGLDVEDEAPADRSNVIDIMAALKKSLGQTEEPPKTKPAAKQEGRKPPTGGAKSETAKPPGPGPKKPARKRA